MARLLVEIDEGLKRDLKSRLMREGETLKEWIARMAEIYVEGAIPAAPARRETREPQSGKHLAVVEAPMPPKAASPAPMLPKAAKPVSATKKDDIFFFD